MKRWYFLAVSMVVLSLLCGCAANQSASLGIIGGADGPTTVYVSGTLGSWVVPLLVVILLLLVAIFLYRRRKR